MYSFNNDYSEGACSEIINVLNTSNLCQSVGYGLDEYCESARKRIQKQLHCDSCDVHFVVGGTQCNQIVIASALRPHEAVIAAIGGHINVHETGAIEACGHKVLVGDGSDGKLTGEGVRKVVEAHSDEHMVKPAMVYLSDATEVGTVYTKAELSDLRKVCDEYGLYMYLDGARLPMALVAEDNDVKFDDLQHYCDVCYLGGTKCGALFGEAVVIFNEALKKDFRYQIKQRGGLLAKGRLLGLQFDTLFKDDLYLRLARHAVDMAQRLQQGMIELGISMYVTTTTNQIFPIMNRDLIQHMEKHYLFQSWERLDEAHEAVRFVTSWACEEEAVDECLAWLKQAIDENPDIMKQ